MRWYHAALFLALCGCPASWGFSGNVVALSGDRDTVGGQVFELKSDAIDSKDLAPVRDVQITCDGCGELRIEGDGRLAVSMGAHYARPRGVTLHVRAPGYRPVEVRVPEMQMISQAGPNSITIVLEREAASPRNRVAGIRDW